ncbi:MAG: hypothetical protein PVJ67_00610 [Candidatus Pacearchaeota archaeon]|jgi:YafQ family addiction module toxin component
MYSLEIKEEADKTFSKLSRKNLKQLKMIDKKIKKIRQEPLHSYKFLKKPLQKFNRVHVDNSFVLVFKIDPPRETVIIFYFDHHDKVYQWKPKEK